jgi:acyl-homoserine-lactone acylase
LRDQPLVVKSSVHGPVVSEKEGKATALRVVGLDQPGVLEQWWDMGAIAKFVTVSKSTQPPTIANVYGDVRRP